MKDNKRQKITFIQYKNSYDIHFDGIKAENLMRLEIEDGQEIRRMGRWEFPYELPYMKLNLEIAVPRDETPIIEKIRKEK